MRKNVSARSMDLNDDNIYNFESYHQVASATFSINSVLECEVPHMITNHFNPYRTGLENKKQPSDNEDTHMVKSWTYL